MTDKSGKYIDSLIQELSALENAGGNYTMSLFTGLSSKILTQVELLRYHNDENLREKIGIDIERLTALIEANQKPSSTFCDGLAGVGWLFSYLNEQNFITINPDVYFKDLDTILEKSLDNFLITKYFDLLHGALGIGLYFLKRHKKDIATKIVKTLFEEAIKDYNEFKWIRKKPDLSEKFIIDLGLAHGQSGILYFLGKCYRENILANECSTMIQGIFNFYTQNSQSIDIMGSYWPQSIPFAEYRPGKDMTTKSRLAWCYGDLGTLHTIFIVSKWINDKAMCERSIQMLIKTTKTIDPAQTRISDSFFCHGRSGVALIYQNLFNLTKVPHFKRAVSFWASELYKSYDHSAFQGSESNTKKTSNSGILNGSQGILLTLLAIKNPSTPTCWQECLFIT